MRKRFSKSSVLGIVILVLGIVAGVFLIQQSQEFRERADLKKEQMIVICHRVSNGETVWEEIEVPESELEVHINHGDLLGNCPDSFELIDRKVDIDDGQGNESNSEDPVKLSMELENDDKVTGDLADGGQLVKISASPTPRVEETKKDATLKFFLKFQGINAKRPAKLINVTLDRGGNETHTYKGIRISPNPEGLYFGQLNDIPSGVFNISFKNDSYLGKTFENVKIEPGTNTWYFENSPLKPGDFNSDNTLDINDIALLLAEITSDSVNANQGNMKFDVDSNAKIDIKDLELVLENYTKLAVFGE